MSESLAMRIAREIMEDNPGIGPEKLAELLSERARTDFALMESMSRDVFKGFETGDPEATKVVQKAFKATDLEEQITDMARDRRRH